MIEVESIFVIIVIINVIAAEESAVVEGRTEHSSKTETPKQPPRNLFLCVPTSYKQSNLHERLPPNIMSLLQPPSDILALLHESFPDSVTSDSDSGGSNEDVFSYVAFLAAGLVELHEYSPKVWKDELSPYLEDLSEVGDDELEAFRVAVEKANSSEDDADSYGGDEDDQFEEVCNIRFK